MTKLPFADRPPTDREVERIRLILSTYQDGTGQQGGALPGWRDFERAVASALGGAAQESKALFDVLLAAPPDEERPAYGLSCKMRRELQRVARDGRATIEVSNAAGEFWDELRKQEVTEESLAEKAPKAGQVISSVVSKWHQAQSHLKGGRVDITRSYYLVLLWSPKLEYQLFQFRLDLIDAPKLVWSVPRSARRDGEKSRRLVGKDGDADIVEWYGYSGGQLKLYPLATSAIWSSAKFCLEPLPEGTETIPGKAERYFPEKWAKANM